MYSAKRLYDLQQLDTRIAQGQQELARVKARLADESELAAARRQVQELEARLDRVSSQRRSLEMSMEETETRLKGVRDRLYGGSVTNPRELEAYQEEEAALDRRLRETEDRLLEAMLEVEEVMDLLRAARESLQEAESRRSQERAQLSAAQEHLEAELREMGQVRSRLTADVPPQVLELYETLRRSRGGVAVVRVERGTCQGCRVTLPTVDLQRSRRGLVQCNSCHRILYVA